MKETRVPGQSDQTQLLCKPCAYIHAEFRLLCFPCWLEGLEVKAAISSHWWVCKLNDNFFLLSLKRQNQYDDLTVLLTSLKPKNVSYQQQTNIYLCVISSKNFRMEISLTEYKYLQVFLWRVKISVIQQMTLFSPQNQFCWAWWQ
mgnify:CR=1 FL=1